MTVNRAIILAAGRGHQVDGFPKLLLRHPRSRRTILDHAIEAFSGKKICVVVGFRAVQIMESYPDLDYVVNPDWALSNNALSLSLALTDEPCYVVSGDIFFAPDLIRAADLAGPNIVLTDPRENRSLTAIHCELDGSGTVEGTYQGPVRNIAHPEAIGLFKVSDRDLLHGWKRRSREHGNLFVGQTLPCDSKQMMAFWRESYEFDEVNTHLDYLRLIERFRP